MYQVLYRKYRPQSFEDVCGQDVIVKVLKNSILNNKINHAYLFSGPRGTGKTSMAKIFARVINCENSVDLKPCGVCVNCTQTTNDVIEIDAASNNGVDEIRELRNKINLVPTCGKYKVYIIDEVHMLTTGAFNALLKTLEEPPSHVIFILATTDPHKIPETILSRCQRLDFKKIAINNIVEKLSFIANKENIKAREDVLREIAILSDGGLRDSISLLDEASIFSNDNITIEDIHTLNGTLTPSQIIDFTVNLSKKDYKILFNDIEKYNNLGKNFIKLVEEIINILKEFLLYQVAPDYFETANPLDEKFIKISKGFTKEEIIKYIYEFNNCLSEMSKTQNHKLIFELSIIKLINVNNLKEAKKISFDEEKTPIETNVRQKEKKDAQNTIINTRVDIPVENNSKVDEELLSYLRKIRVENTLSKLNQKLLPQLKQQLDNITGFLLDPTYSQCVSMIMDGNLKASSDKNIIFVFNKKHTSDDFNMNLLIAEELLERLFGTHYDVISTWEDDWEIIRDDFNNKKKKFHYKKEDFNLNEFLNKETKDEIDNLFSDIIEYS